MVAVAALSSSLPLLFAGRNTIQAELHRRGPQTSPSIYSTILALSDRLVHNRAPQLFNFKACTLLTNSQSLCSQSLAIKVGLVGHRQFPIVYI